jgi:DNA-binding NarL/FixJ family response regulator
LAETFLAIVDDPFFLSKIQQTAKLLGLRVEVVSPGKLAERAAQIPVCGVILDLNHRSGSALDTLRAIKAEAKIGATRVVGFLSHVQTDLATAAREAGCDLVLARSTFSQKLPELLRDMAGHAQKT